MKNLVFTLAFLSVCVFAQNPIETSFIKKTPLHVESVVGIDNFGILYYLNNNIFYKKAEDKTLNYHNIQLGNVTCVNTFNSLKINVFYKDFNTVIILDNRLAEIHKLDFNTLQPYKNVTHVSTGNDTTIWIYNQNTQQLELYDFKTNKSRATTLPILSEVYDLKSNYNVCWLLTKDTIYKFNYFGSLLLKLKNNGYTSLKENNGNIYLKKENELFYLKKESDTIVKIKTPELLIKQFFVTNETLYIYDEEFLHEYQLITN